MSGERGRIPKFEGVFAILPTPFNTDLSLDEEGLRSNCHFLVASSVDVIVVLGTEGEFYALADAERRRVLEVAAEAVGGRKPVVCGVSHPSSLEAAALARHASSSGVDAVMSLPPYFVRAGFDGALRHFGAVAEAGIPVIIYNSPNRVGYGLSPDELDRICEATPGVVGVKQASPDLSELAALAGMANIANVIGGAETVFWPALCAGARGSTATAAAVLPGPFVAMWDAFETGDQGRGQAVYISLEPLRQAYRLMGGQAPVVKRLAALLGLAGGPVRPPLVSAPGTVDALLRLVLAEVGAS